MFWTVCKDIKHIMFAFRSFLEVIYSLSYLHYSTLAVIVSIIVGLIVSAITGM